MHPNDTPSTPDGKRCTKCGETKPRAAFSTMKASRDGLFTICRPCKSAYDRARYTSNPEPAKARANARRASDPERDRESSRQWRLNNRERFLTVKRRWHAQHREHVNAQSRQWYAANTDRARANMRRWMLENPERWRAICMARRARESNAPVIEKIDRAAIIARDRSICHICKKPVAPKDMSLDHLVPLIHGGNHTADNLAVAHRRCNSRRGRGRIPAQLRLLG